MDKLIYSIYRNFFFRKKGYSISPYKVLNKLNESQYWPREKMRAFQTAALNKLINLSRDQTVYYTEKIGINTQLTEPSEILEKVPLLRKKDLIGTYDAFKTDSYQQNYQHSTSGSSGDPLVVGISELAEVYRKASFLRFKKWWGIEPTDKSVLIWRYDRANEGFLAKIKTYLRFRYDVNVYQLDEENIFEHFEKIEKFNPSFIRGYMSGMLEFSRLILEHGLVFKKAKFKVAIVTSEILFDADRKIIEKALNCKVANEYGSADAGLFAFECPEGNMHINEESVYLNVINKTDVVVTELFNDSMPLLNYCNDDQVVISNKYCGCKRTSRIIEEVIGRVSGYIIRTDGTKVNQGVFIDMFSELLDVFPDSVKKFKVYQKDNTFRILLIPLKNFNKQVERHIIKEVGIKIDPNFEIEFELVERIEREKSGKLRYFVNLTN